MLEVLMIAAAMASGPGERPTREGDRIGTAMMQQDGTITMRLRSVECDGTIAEGVTKIHPRETHYGQTVEWLGGISRGETKFVFARQLPPCPAR